METSFSETEKTYKDRVATIKITKEEEAAIRSLYDKVYPNPDNADVVGNLVVGQLAFTRKGTEQPSYALNVKFEVI